MLTPQQKQVGRRNFLKAAATLPVILAYGASRAIARPVRCGIIGGGASDSEGRVLMKTAPADVMKIVAVAEINPNNREQALGVLRQRFVADPVGYEDYREMLQKADIEAVIVSAPLWKHAEMTIAALQAGKHVFCEKTMAKTMNECRQMIDTAKQTGLNLQIGHQRFYNDIYHQAKKMIDEGLLGDVRHIRMLWHRNTHWRRDILETDKNFDARSWGYKSVDEWRNWRLYNEFSEGLMTELASHQIAIANWFTGSIPKMVSASGQIALYNDGREVWDHVYGIFEYPNNVTVTYSSIQSNDFDNYYEEVMGTKGTIILTGETEAMLFSSGKDAKATEVTVEKAEGGPVMNVSESRPADAAGGSAVGGGGASSNDIWRAYTDELRGFCETIREGVPNLCTGEIGYNAALAVLSANDSIRTNSKIDLSGHKPMA